MTAECWVPTEKVIGFCKRGKEQGETGVTTKGAFPPGESHCPSHTAETTARPEAGRLSGCLCSAAVPWRGFRALGDEWVTSRPADSQGWLHKQPFARAAGARPPTEETPLPGLSGPTQPLPRTGHQ